MILFSCKCLKEHFLAIYIITYNSEMHYAYWTFLNLLNAFVFYHEGDCGGVCDGDDDVDDDGDGDDDDDDGGDDDDDDGGDDVDDGDDCK